MDRPVKFVIAATVLAGLFFTKEAHAVDLVRGMGQPRG